MYNLFHCTTSCGERVEGWNDNGQDLPRTAVTRTQRSHKFKFLARKSMPGGGGGTRNAYAILIVTTKPWRRQMLITSRNQAAFVPGANYCDT